MEVAELQEKIREVYKLINYQNVEFEWNEKLRQARKILNEIQSKLHQPTVIDSNLLESFYTDYDNWCRNLWDGEFYVKWLNRGEFFESIKTYDDWNNLQKDVGLLDDNRTI